ncbi:hypothetical protein Plhal304r1_c047g0128691 [Plasmopara halstedii]
MPAKVSIAQRKLISGNNISSQYVTLSSDTSSNMIALAKKFALHICIDCSHQTRRMVQKLHYFGVTLSSQRPLNGECWYVNHIWSFSFSISKLCIASTKKIK